MNAREATRQYRLSQWAPIVKECHASGMSIRSWCALNDVDEKRFYYWQKKIREIAGESLPVMAQESKFVQLPATTSVATVNKQGVSGFEPSMVIRVGKAAIELTDHVQPELLATVLKVLSNAE